MIKTRFMAAAIACLPAFALAQSVRVASWNLGWHVSSAEVPNWVDKCGRSFKKNTTTKRWDVVPADTAGATVGWFIKESRASLEDVDLAMMPPCGVYQAPNFTGIAVTQDAYANRLRQLATLMQSTVRPDVIAFQEISGVAAVKRHWVHKPTSTTSVRSMASSRCNAWHSLGANNLARQSNLAKLLLRCRYRRFPLKTRSDRL